MTPTDEHLNKTEQKKGFRWTAQRHRAAILVAENDLSDVAIAQEIGISRTTLHTWKQHPEFAAQVGDHIGQIQAAMLRLGIAKKHKRLEILDDLKNRLLTVIEERAEEYEGKAPGGGTGTVVRQVKQIGSGRDAQMVEEYAVDDGVIGRIQRLDEQAAKELGQWTEKSQVELSGGIRREYVIVRDGDAGADPRGEFADLGIAD